MSDKKQNPPHAMGMRPKHGPVMEIEKPKNTAQVLKRLAAYIGKSKYLFISLVLVMIAITLLNLAAPTLQGEAIDAVSITAGKLSVNWSRFVKLLVVLGVIYLSNAFMQYMQGIISSKLSQTTVYNMRAELFEKIVRLPIRYMDTHRHGDIMSRMTNDVENISNSVSQSIGSLISGVLTICGTVAIMLYHSPTLTAVSMLTVLLTLGATAFLSKYMRKLFVKQQVLLGRLNGHAEETVTGYRTIVAFGKEGDQEEAFDEISDRFRTTAIKAQILGGSMGPVMNFIGNFGFLLIAAAGGYLAWHGNISIGVIQAFLIYAKQFTRPINELANQFAQIQTALAGAERVFAVLDEPTEADEGTIDADVKGDISFENINFSYKQGEPVLKGFSLEVKAGQKIALVGATGSGKTTVVNLLTRFYDVDSGRILIDGTDIRDMTKDSLRSSIAIVLQDTVLFSDTVAANIRYGTHSADAQQIQNAAEMANADIFIERLSDGYDTELSESGANLSQGQRQLLSIARAVMKNPKILILDEATSSVDTRTEMHIQQAMIALMKNRTSLIIAHRLSTIRDADMIVVLDHGRIAETGSHEELLAKKGSYYTLYQSQFAGNKT